MSYTHLTEKERYVISHLKSVFSLREIARRLGRHHTSISREINRNRPTYADDAVYWYTVTHPVAEKRKHKARSHRRQSYLPLVQGEGEGDVVDFVDLGRKTRLAAEHAKISPHRYTRPTSTCNRPWHRTSGHLS
jgi:hypothetical protein